MVNPADYRKPGQQALEGEPASGRKRMELLEDLRRHSSQAHWAQTGNPASLRKLFEGTCRRLRKYGFSLYLPDLAYETEKGYDVILAFEIACRPKDSRNSDTVAMVTLFGKEGKPEMIKLSPYEPRMTETLISALSMAFVNMLRNEPDPSLRLSCGPSFETK